MIAGDAEARSALGADAAFGADPRAGGPALWRRRVMVTGSGLAAGLVLLPFTAKPITWDELLYMGLAFHTERQAHVLNRYASVYAMKPFMWLAGDPYLGTRLYWCFLFAVTVATLVSMALRLAPPSRHAAVLAGTLFLLAGQEALFQYPGIAYPDYGVMTLLTLSVGLALGRVLHGRDFRRRDAFVLGVLCLAGLKTKETALPLVLLPAIFFITPTTAAGSSGGSTSRPATGLIDPRSLRLATWWLAGVCAGAATIMVFDRVFLGDLLFSVRPSSWTGLLSFNVRGRPAEISLWSWLGWMVRPEGFVAFALYLAAGLMWARGARNLRLVALYAVPAVYLAMLGLLETFVYMAFTERYAMPALPLVCFLGPMALADLATEEASRRPMSFAPGWTRALIATGIIAVAIAEGSGLVRLSVWAVGDAARLHFAPTVMLGVFVVLLFLPARPRTALAIVVLAVFVSGFPPALRVISGLARRDVQRAGDTRFGGLYDVTRAVRIESAATVFVSNSLYRGAVRPGVVVPLVRMSFGVPLPAKQIAYGAGIPSDRDYVLAGREAYEEWAARAGVDHARVIISRDGAVALICQRGPCPLR